MKSQKLKLKSHKLERFTPHHFYRPSSIRKPLTRKSGAGFTHAPSFSKSGAGFTLVELLVVIAIIGIITSISWVVLKTLQPSWRLDGAVRDLATDFRYAQQQSVTEQINYGVHFSSSTDEYQIIRYGTTTEEILKKSLPQGLRFYQIIGFTDDEVIFNPYGAAKEAGSVSLINIEQKIKTIEVRPSGFVKIK